jgi:hypothetical protein
VIYVDSSVVLARLLAEEKAPSESFFNDELVASALLEYEVWNRLHASAIALPRSADARTLLERIDFYEMTPTILARALEPFPVSIRTLDAMHLATAIYLINIGNEVELASYDRRMLAAAAALGISAYNL